MERDKEIVDLTIRISQLELKIEQLRFSRRVLLNLLEKVLMEQKPTKVNIIKFVPRREQS